ncbi:nucleoside diphosphate kinase regulator [Hymenobacter rubripertinctus]|uniref:Nucleoside diphosphate kinase regulator n=1 Tax=Hymenobacter rubripertinctus TaxID=2029981 RepID=A0A418QV85_9BACT|nr:nucleoside diphosphate kinase regulator [Hymenobacter rubripertinctus]RIY09054.1 nucleoside diphosphate kinase regulator [Hymenobacter rubripertinctus]
MMKAILVTKADHVRLLELVAAERQLSGTRVIGRLSSELHRATLVDSAAVPADVITMNSVVRLRELTSQMALEITLVYPKEADVARRKISILAPVATAVLGRRVGDNVTWPLPKGLATYQIEALLHQPEAATGPGRVDELLPN